MYNLEQMNLLKNIILLLLVAFSSLILVAQNVNVATINFVNDSFLPANTKKGDLKYSASISDENSITIGVNNKVSRC